MCTPKELLYSDDHIWLMLEGDLATLGITDYGQRQLGEVVYVELPEVGEFVVRGEPFGSVGTADMSDVELISPVTGEVMEVNESLADDPSQVNSDPYGDGWMIKVQVQDLEELDELLPAEEYEILTTG
ncbi:MAG: glycine cleavage system protein GcvH [Candidatus Latescibacterota bacterium]|nr:MAG: glycine cleavage system protein GcvH [Candidatus Latescibacterota bacterium]